jgi:mRNA interferase YafQ
MFQVTPSKRFAKSFRKLKTSGKFSDTTRNDLAEIISILARNAKLPIAFSDHALRGEFLGYRECHIRGDLLLVYRIYPDERIVVLNDIGSHAQLFG